MDITKFINSKSVAKYLNDINYKFSAQEAAFIIAHSRKKFKDKCLAWQTLINETTDCPVICRFDHTQYQSLHKFLKDYMALVERVGEKTDAESLQGEEYELFTAFESMWFATPVPFKKGDIVYNVTAKKSNAIHSQPFVIEDLSCWGDEDLERRKGSDYSDMSAHGYVLREGNFDYDWTWNYLDFEYCREDMLSGENRALLALSNYIKGNVDLEHFLNAYLLICDEERIKSNLKTLYVDDEGLRLAGLKK